MEPEEKGRKSMQYTTEEVAAYVTGGLTHKEVETPAYSVEEVRAALHNALTCLEDIHDGIEVHTLNRRQREAPATVVTKKEFTFRFAGNLKEVTVPVGTRLRKATNQPGVQYWVSPTRRMTRESKDALNYNSGATPFTLEELREIGVI